MPSISGTCDVCSEATSKYRCPTCEILYCSLNCFKGHKESCKPGEHKQLQAKSKEVTRPQATDKEEGEISTEESDREDMEDEDRVHPDKLQQLGESEELKVLLHNPHLQQMLSHLDQTEDKEKAIANAMQEPLFVEFADQCLKTVEGGDNERTTDST